ncbi:MAG: T9SS type A sorting domain-containing protein [Candidatus Tenebribacter burtonii]|nr:T9SS type A sorting domain-containing protein [Candidatus Tenebribacter burtonii]
MKIKYLVFCTIVIVSGLLYSVPETPENQDNFFNYPFGTIYQEEFHFDYENFSFRDPIDFDSTEVSFEGNWPFGYSYSLSAYEVSNLVFTGSGGGVLITDVSDPANPQVISEVKARALIDASYYDAVTQRLYLAAYFSGVEIWDLSDINNPTFLSRCPTEPYPRAGIYASGNYVFAATVAHGLRVIDVSNPAEPFEAAFCNISNNIWFMDAAGDYIYLTDSTAGLKVVDISNPLSPSVVASYPNAKGDICISGNYAYFAQNGFGLRILDITDPLNAFEVGTCSLTNYPHEIAIVGNYAFLAGNECGLVAINVIDPANPFIESANADYFQHIIACGGNIFVTSEMDGFFAFDVSDPASMQNIGGLELAGYTVDLAVSGDHLYIGSSGFRVLDISDPSNPIETGNTDIPAACVAVGNDYVVCCPKSMGGNNPVHIMNVDDPANPYSEGYYTCSAMSYDLAVQENLAAVACWWDGVRLLDFLTPTNPSMTSHILGWTNGATPGVDFCYAQAVDIQGDFLYIIDYGPFPDDDTFGLYIIDISIPTTPVVVNRYTDFVSMGYDIDVEGDYAYIADANGGMEVIDISDQNAPVTSSYSFLEDVAQGVHVDGNYCYIANYILGGVQVFSIEDPSNPVNIGHYKRTGCFAMNVDSKDNYIYVADGLTGVQVYNNLLFEPPASGTIVGTVAVFPSANLEEIEVNVDNIITNPDENGIFTYEVPVGNYTVSASLSDYESITIEDVQVIENQATIINFDLYYLQAPENLEAVNTNSIVELSWEHEQPTDNSSTNQTISSREFQNFNVYRIFNGGAIELLGTTTVLSYEDILENAGEYDYYVTAAYDQGNESEASNFETVFWDGTGSDNLLFTIENTLYQNSPNPFNPSTTISFSLNTESSEDTELVIYNIKGQKIRQFSISNFQSSIVWDGTDQTDKQVSSGVYFYKLKSGDFQQVRKMLLMK